MRKGIVLSSIFEKGGTGKSTITYNLAYYLSQKYKVLVIDLDGQSADITYFILGEDKLKSRDSMKTIKSVFENSMTLDNVILTVKDNLDLIPANTYVTDLSPAYKTSVFKNIIRRLKEEYDFIFIDVSPSPNHGHVLCLSVTDYLIPITVLDAACITALMSLDESVYEVQDASNPKLKYLGIVVNKYDNRTNISKTVLNQLNRLTKELGTSIFKTKIHQNVSLSEQTLFHQSIFEYLTRNKAAAKAAKEYASLAEEILSRISQIEGDELNV